MVSQRALARKLGIAIGLTNLLLRRMLQNGWIRLIRIRRTRVRYLITPAGIAEKMRISRAYLVDSVRFYCEARDKIRRSFAALAADGKGADGRTEKRVVFYGVGEVAEIGFVCLQNSDLRLVGVVDETSMKTFFGLPVQAPDRLSGLRLDGVPFDSLVVMSFDDVEGLESKLQQRGVPSERVFWL